MKTHGGEKLELNVRSIGIAAGATVGIIYAVCIALYAIAPATITGIGTLLFHGVKLEAKPIILTDAIIGLVLWVIVAGTIGSIFAALNNKILKK